MNRRILLSGLVVLVLGVATFIWRGSADAGPRYQGDDQVARGEYLASVASCISCHTPFKAEYNVQDPADLSIEQLKTLSLDEHQALDLDRRFAGGRVFVLPGQGVITVSNITPDPETGIGDWSADEIKTAIRTGVRPDGSHIHPVMPYRVYRNMAEDDLDAIVAYLQSLPPVVNEVTRTENVPVLELPPVEPPATAPDSADISARGAYLMTSVLACTDCHTPIDEQTGAPVMERYLGGGQPFEAFWGIVYGANLTPHATGLADWTDDQIKRAILNGIGQDNRRLILMPWGDFNGLSANDINAVVDYLRNGIQPVDNEVPAVAANPPFIERVEPEATDGGNAENGEATTSEAEDDAEDEDSKYNWPLLAVIAAVVIVAVGGVLARRRQAGSTK